MVVVDKLRRVFVAFTSQSARRWRIPKPNARGRNRDNAGGHSVLIHLGEGVLRRPLQDSSRQIALLLRNEPIPRFGQIDRGQNMVVHIDKARLSGGCALPYTDIAAPPDLSGDLPRRDMETHDLGL